MKKLALIFLSGICFASCGPDETEVSVKSTENTSPTQDTQQVIVEHKVVVETTYVNKTVTEPVPAPVEKPDQPKPLPPAKGPYSNKAFRKVMIKKIDDNRWNVKGEAQVFEASFSYVVEDGHYQLQKGHEMTDNGAPAWGNFDFNFNLKKQPRVGSTPHLILLVYSAKDGSPTHELPIPLP